MIKSGRTTGVTRGIVVRIEVKVNTKLQYGGDVSAIIGEFEIGPDNESPAADGEISRGGDSGSVWLALDKKQKPTGVMLGLHFAGDADDTVAEFGLACYAKSVMMALEVEPAGAIAPESTNNLADGQDLRGGFDK